MGYRDVVEDDPGEGPGVSDPPPGVGVDPVDQSGDLANPVPGYPRGGKLGGGGDPAPDYQDAVVTAGDVSLDQDPPTAGPAAPQAVMTSSTVDSPMKTSRPWWPETGLITTGAPR